MDRRRTLHSIVLATAVVAAVFILLIVGKIINKYTPSKERMSLLEYYGLTEESSAAMVLNHALIPQKATLKDGTVYIDYETVRDVFNKRFYWDADEKLLLYTTSADVVSAVESGKDYYVSKQKKSKKYIIFYVEGETAYIAMDYVKMFTDLDYQWILEPNRIIVTTDWSDVSIVKVKKDTQIRYRGGIKSPILTEVAKEETLTLLERGESWDKVMTKDGIIGYVRQNKLWEGAEERSYEHTYQEETFAHLLKEEKIQMGWHQVTTLEANKTVEDVVGKTKGLNVISPTWFYLNDNEGALENLSSIEYVDYCHSLGIEVWPLVSNLENKDVDTTEVLTHTSKRTRVINQLMKEAARCGFDGINVDFESIEQEAGEGYLQFIREISLKCKKKGIRLSVDNYVPTEYTAFYDRNEQANFADYIVIMGYDEHYVGSEEGSVSSIGFVRQGIADTLKEAPANQTILGAPFYTRIWKQTPKEPEDDVKAAAEDYVPYELTSQAYNMEDSWNLVAENGATPVWSEETGQYYAEYQNGEDVYKVWLESQESMELRMQAAKEYDLAGVSFWKLGLEKAEIWDVIQKYKE